MTPEAKVKKKVVDVIKKYGAYYFFPATGGYGRSGVPDVVCCYRGVFVAIECKAGSNKPTPLQEAEMQKIRQAQGFVLVVNETNITEVAVVFDRIDKGITQ
jgi:Holliday junction resolvase